MRPLILPLITLISTINAAIQCYVGQKLFSLESNMAVCAPFIPYHCASACEWRPNCTSHVSYDVFDGRRTFVSGVLINSKSLMLLCCTSLSTQVQADRHGERCAWRDSDSISVLGPSIRAEPVLGTNHYIREIKMEREGDSRVDVQIEVCQYERELEQCKEDKMSESEVKKLNGLKKKLESAMAVKEGKGEKEEKEETVKATTIETTTIREEKIIEGDKEVEKKAVDKVEEECHDVIKSECGRNIHSRIIACCKDLSACDRQCLKGVEKSLLDELLNNQRGCTTKEVRSTLDCLAKKVISRSIE